LNTDWQESLCIQEVPMQDTTGHTSTLSDRRTILRRTSMRKRNSWKMSKRSGWSSMTQSSEILTLSN
jgi:hypothetical protein